MSLTSGDEFRAAATPTQELLLKLQALADAGGGAVMTAAESRATADRRVAGERTADLVRMARLAEPAYQAMSMRIDEDLDRMDERAVDSLQKIEHALIELRLQRQRLLERTYKDESGRPIAITRDGSAAYYVDDAGGRVEEDMFLQIREKLAGMPVVEEFESIDDKVAALNAAREKIHDAQQQGGFLRDDLAAGDVSAEDAGRRSAEIQGSMTTALDEAEAALLGARGDDATAPDAGLNRTYEKALTAALPAPQ
jgi:hypothetical protein